MIAPGTQSARKEGGGRQIRERNRTRILDASIEIFTCKGYDGASIAEIAERSGLPKANVYYYFKTKKAIYATIIDNLISEWDAALAHLQFERDPADAIADYVRAKLEFSLKRARQSKMFANEIVHGGRFLSRANRAHMRAITVEKAKVFEVWAEAGRMDPIHPMHLFILLWGSTQFYADFGVMAENALGARRISRAHFEAAAETILHVVLKGCGVRHEERIARVTACKSPTMRKPKAVGS
jgi:TetR/AcrR family transcriptional regulator